MSPAVSGCGFVETSGRGFVATSGRGLVGDDWASSAVFTACANYSSFNMGWANVRCLQVCAWRRGAATAARAVTGTVLCCRHVL